MATVRSRDQQRRLTRRVFISSTSIDLRAHRDRVRDTLLSLGLFPVGMEHFGAQGTGDASSVSVDQLVSSDVYLGIYAWRYGTIPPGHERSVTHQEYEEAIRLGMPSYLFMADASTDAPMGSDDLFPSDVRDPEHREKLDRFRADVGRTHVVDFFTTPGDLAARVATALSKYLLQIQREELEHIVHVPRDLPPRASGFVGRERELASLFSVFTRGQDGDAVALVGMAGTGKSALAAEAVNALANSAEAFTGGIAWIRCDGRTGLDGLASVEDQILAAWGTALTPEELAGAVSTERQLEARERALRRRLTSSSRGNHAPALLLLDNVEHDLPLTRALETLAPLGIRMLLTARHEPASPRVRIISLDMLDSSACIQLFEERLRARGGEWDASRDRGSANTIVETLGRLPLAIELAAARAARAHQGVAALAQELQEADRLGALRDPLDPTHSVRYAFSRSLEVLGMGQRARFALLGLPAGPDWPRQFIERLFDATSNPEPPNDDLETIAALSLVSLSNGGDGSRVRLHPLLRDLAREEWHHKPEESQKSDIRALFGAASDLITGHERDFALLAREEDLIIGSLRVAPSAGVDPERIALQIKALESYLDLGGHWAQGLELFTLAGELSRQTGDLQGEAWALNNLGVFAQRLGDLQAAGHAYEQALSLRRELGDRQGEAETLGNLGSLAHARRQPEEAQALFQQALAIRRELGDRQGEAVVLGNLGLLAAEQGRIEEARDALERSLALADPTAAVLNNLGGVAEAQGQPSEARGFFERALGAARASSDRAAEATAHDNLGNVARSLGEFAQAAASYEQALVIRRALGDERGEATTLHNLGVLAEAAGDRAKAHDHFTSALHVATTVGDNPGGAAALISLGALARAGHELEAAQGLYEQALALYRDVGDQEGEALTLAQLGALAQAQARPDEAATAYEQALAIRRAVGDSRGSGLLLNSLGLLDYARGRPVEAATRFREALQLLKAAGDDEAARTVSENLASMTTQHEPAVDNEPVMPAEPMPPGQKRPFVGVEPDDLADDINETKVSQETAQARRRRWPWSR